MNRFRNELRVIPRAAWGVGIFLYLAIAIGLTVAIHFSGGQEFQGMPAPVKLLFPFIVSLLIFVPAALIGYVNGDAKRRGMRYVMWTLLAILVPDAIGIILYFILRDPLPKPCTGCGTVVRPGFAFCPKCGTEVRPACSSCGKAIEPDWLNCAYCGKKIAAAPTEQV
jgi:RNA polymerase subunit RPABC4/transcription elongation factor Spt4